MALYGFVLYRKCLIALVLKAFFGHGIFNMRLRFLHTRFLHAFARHYHDI